ncbi:hypothetical protein ACIBFB_07235 [Nocardiopsis sp. NPDC050513]
MPKNEKPAGEKQVPGREMGESAGALRRRYFTGISSKKKNTP